MPTTTPPALPEHRPDRRLHVIGAASGVGAQDHQCVHGPVVFHHSQAWHELEHHPAIVWGTTLYAPDRPGLAPVERIARLCGRLADEVAGIHADRRFPLVIGGDHSVAIGTWSGLARACGMPLGLLWIDAHMDSHTPQTSHSGAIHGMPLACLLGHGDKRLLGFGLPGGQLLPAHTVVLGARSHEDEELTFLERMGVRVIGAGEITRRGFQAAFAEAMEIVLGAPGGFGITLDLDAFDPRLIPGVGSPEAGGLDTVETLQGLQRLARSPALLGMEIVEYNPDRDQNGVTANLIADLVGILLPPDKKRS